MPASLAACGGAGAASVPSAKVDRFDEVRAFRILRAQVERFGNRPAGSPASRRAGDYLRPLLPGGRFEAVPGGLRNIVGVVPGTKPAIVIGAHYDTEALPADFVGANDSAAGTAGVIELARTLSSELPAGHREIRFVLFDGEEDPPGCNEKDFEFCALRGSRIYAAAHRREVGDMILLDYIANRDARIPREENSSPELWERLRVAADQVGTESTFPATTQTPVLDDHIPFLEQGVPSIDLIDFSYRYADSVQDTPDKLEPAVLDLVGETVAQLVINLSAR